MKNKYKKLEDIDNASNLINRDRKVGLYSVTDKGVTKLKMYPSMGREIYEDGGKHNKKNTGININKIPMREEDLYIARNNNIAPISNPIITPMSINDTTLDLSNMYNPTKKDIRQSYRNAKNLVKNNNITTNDAISLSGNILGSIISNRINNSMLNKLQAPPAPIARNANKLKTRININPQLDKMRESLASYERDIDNNVASSRSALSKKKLARLNNVLKTNELYGTKENTETELINKDRLNQQEITDKNISDYNAWTERNNAFKNTILEKKSENNNSLVGNINQGLQDIIGRRERRESERQTRLAMAAANPNVNPRILRDLGITGITDEDIERWEKAFGKTYN